MDALDPAEIVAYRRSTEHVHHELMPEVAD
jgi:hypothetical protein